MYGNLRPGAGGPTRFAPDEALEAMERGGEAPPSFADISWQLLLLVSAEFLLFATVVVPLLPNDNWGDSVSNFWLDYSWIAAATCLPYILLTLPVAVGYTWFIQAWPWNGLVWLIIVGSLASVVHIASVATDPRGVFCGCCSISGLLILFSALRIFFPSAASFAKTPLAFVVAVVWQTAVFVPIFFASALSSFSALGAGIASLVCSVCLIAEFRLIENKTSVLAVKHGSKPIEHRLSDLSRMSSQIEAEIFAEPLVDPFTWAIWVNCASWRFLFQSLILLQKLVLQFFLASVLALVWLWKQVVTCFARRVDPKWLTPTIVGKFVNVAATASVARTT